MSDEERIESGDVARASDVLGEKPLTEKIAEVKQGAYLFCEEDGSLYKFDAFQGDNIALFTADGSPRVYPFKGKGYTFYVVTPEAQEQIEKEIAAIKRAKAKLGATLKLLEAL